MSNDKSGHGAGEFATKRRKWLLLQARNVCRNESDAEDLVQESLLRFIQVFGKMNALPEDRICESWLVTTLNNLFFDQCRRRKVQANGAKDPTLSDEALVVQEPAAQPVYDAVTDEQFAKALQALSPKIRATFELHAAGKKYQDISRSLDIPIGTVAKRLHDARAKLRELLGRSTTPGVH
ncbi:RNA polymerase sigma factor [Hyalangium rubrum]|uniref:RNA polymerase sigma factor n=1 Tax=Hyalangium rubrum TaxID=3103134 RepID=A0ABU5H5F5_9BACT|nr:RNA polymerase sigma factor [Hyalangium sp. s54d21]MDY7228722.1 RNA polymerase sigma factor [Hyalangium sp. s54d21]